MANGLIDMPGRNHPVMLNQFSRNEMLLGSESTAILAAKTVAVFGVGGVGSFAVEGLARAGIGHLVIVDNDTVCLTNINRQLIATHKTIGRPKVEVMKERILEINPEAQVTALQCFYGPENADGFEYASFDYILDCIDTVSSKLVLIERAQAFGVPIVSSMGTGNKLDPARFEFTDITETSICPLARVMRRELKKRGILSLKVLYSRETPRCCPVNEEDANKEDDASSPGSDSGGSSRKKVPGSVSFVPPVAGLMLAGRVVKDLLGIA